MNNYEKLKQFQAMLQEQNIRNNQATRNVEKQFVEGCITLQQAKSILKGE